MKKYGPVLLSLIILPCWPALIWLVLHGGFEHLVQALTGTVLSEVVGNGLRWFLLSLWLSGSVAVGMLCWLCLRDRDYRYALAALAGLLLFAGTTWFSMPFGDRAERRWQVETQLASGPDRVYWSHARQLFRDLQHFGSDSGYMSQFQENLRLQNRDRPDYGYLAEDVEAVREELRLPLTLETSDAERKNARRRLADALEWIPDQLLLAREYAMTGFVRGNGTRVSTLEPETSEAFIRVIILSSEDPEAWAALALSELWAMYSINTGSLDELKLDYVSNLVRMAAWLANGQDPITDRRIRRWLDGWSEEPRGVFETLLARARVEVSASQQKDVPAEVQAQADQPLAILVERTDYLRRRQREATLHPGKVEVDLAAHGIVQKDSDYQYYYPEVGQSMAQVTTLLSLDVASTGEITYASIAKSSGFFDFDRQTLAFSRNWMLPPADAPRRVLVQVHFLSTLLGWDDYYSLQEPLAEAAARAAARRDQRSAEQALEQLQAIRKERFPQRMNRVVEYNFSQIMKESISRDRQLGRNNLQGWKALCETMQTEVARLPDQVAPLIDLGRSELTIHRLISEDMYYKGGLSQQNLDDWQHYLQSAREHFLRALLNQPGNANAWFAWGATWANEDVELAAGAIYHSRTLRGKDSDLSKALASSLFGIEGWILSLLDDSAKKRVEILLSRMAEQADGEAAELARTPLPRAAFAAYLPARSASVLVRDEAGVSHVDFQRLGIRQGSRTAPIYPRLSRPEGSTILLLRLDVDSAGKVLAVMVARTSGVPELDQAAVDAAYDWRFATGSARLVDVPVHFEYKGN